MGTEHIAGRGVTGAVRHGMVVRAGLSLALVMAIAGIGSAVASDDTGASAPPASLVASPGASTAAPYPAAAPTGGSTFRTNPSTPRSGRNDATSAAAATPTAPPKKLSSQVPIDIGEVGLATRSMWWNRSGRPRSATRK